MKKILAMMLLTMQLGLAGGCGGSTKTVTRTEGPAGSETTVTETREESGGGGPTGILSGTVNAIGFIISLPFKIVGGLIEIIF